MACLITGVAGIPSGATYPNAFMYFERINVGVIAQDGMVVIPEKTITQSDDLANVSFSLVAGVYQGTIQTTLGDAKFRITVPDAPTANLGDLIGDFTLPIYDANVQAVLDARDDAEAAAVAAALYAPAYYPDLAALLASTDSWTTGTILNTRIEGVAYQVVASGQQYTTTGGVKIKIYDGRKVIYPQVVGGATAAMMDWRNTARGSFRFGGSETVPTNDERNFGRGDASANWWNDPANHGLYSVSFNLSGLSYGTYATTFGHNCSVYGVAGVAGGAGSCVGNPDDPNNLIYNFTGYCSIAWGKNNLVAGEKSAGFGEECDIHGRASVGLGYNANTGVSGNFAHTGQVAIGYDVLSVGDGAVAIGKDIAATGGSKLIGSGINSGNPLAASNAEVGIGWNVTKATIVARPGPGTTTGVANVRLRTADSATAKGIEIAAYDDSIKARINTQLTNGGGGGYWALQFDVMNAGAIVRGFDVDYDGTISLLPATTNTHRIGSATRAINYIYLQNAPVITSDARTKTKIKPVDDAALRAWAKVEYGQYLLLNQDGVGDGDENVGVIAQQIIDAFESEGLNALDWALIVESPPLMDIEGETKKDRAKREAARRFGVNYTQCAVFEAVMTRNMLSDITSRLKALESK